jgi:hypothetical protein
VSRGGGSGEEAQKNGDLAAQRKLSKKEIFKLILAAYATSLPYLVLFVVLMLIAVWIVTTFLFH